MSNGRIATLGLGLVMLGVGCGGAPPTVARVAAAPTPVRAEPSAATLTAADAEPTAAKEEVATTSEVPSACDDKASCQPPTAFVDAVCKHKFPDLPLFLFAGRMPWKHLYVKAEWVEPVNPHGGD